MRVAVSTASRTARAPSAWPSERSRPRDFAQRPLPSMMIATWRGISEAPFDPFLPLTTQDSLSAAGVGPTLRAEYFKQTGEGGRSANISHTLGFPTAGAHEVWSFRGELGTTL